MTQHPQGISIRDQIVPQVPGRSTFDVLRDLGVDAFEAMVDLDGSLPHVRDAGGQSLSMSDDAAVRRLKQRLEDERARISALLIMNDFGGPEAERHVEWAVRVAHAATALGVPVVRVDPLMADRSLPPQQACDRFFAQMSKVLAQTAGTGVEFGMENHGPTFNDPRWIDRVLAAVGDPRLGLTLDTGNFYWWGHPLSRVYALIEQYAPRAKHTHIKNVGFPPESRDAARPIGHEYKQRCCAIDEGDLDLRRVVRILRSGGYRRDLCIEDESLFKVPEASRRQVLGREVSSLRSAFREGGRDGADAR